MSSIKKHVVRGGRRRTVAVVAAVSALLALAVGGAALTIRPASPELVLAQPTVTCGATTGPRVNLAWTDTAPSQWYRPLWRVAGSGDAGWQVGAWTPTINARSTTVTVANARTYDFVIEGWGSTYRNSNTRSVLVNCGGTTTTVAPTTTRPATTTVAPTTTRPTTTTTRPPTTTTPTTSTIPPAGAWVRTVNGTGSDAAYEVVTDAAGNVFVTGTFYGRVTIGTTALQSAGESDVFVVKLNSAGSVQWARRWGGSSYDSAQTLALDGAGNVTVGGTFSGTASFGGTSFTARGSSDLFVAQYNGSDGSHRWSRGIGGTLGERVNAIAIDASSNIYFTGYFQGTIDFGTGVLRVPFTSDLDVFVTKLNNSGTTQWAKNFTNTGNDQGYGIAVTSVGNIAVSGTYSNGINFGGGEMFSPNAMTNAFVAKFTTAGAHIWSRSIGDPAKNDNAESVVMDASGNVVVVGNGMGSIDFGGGNTTSLGSNDGWVAKYASANGAHQWSKRLGGTNNDYADDVAVDATGNVWVAGSFESPTAAFGGAAISNAGQRDIYLAKYSATGAHLSSRAFGSRDQDNPNGLGIAPTGHPIIVGYYYGTFPGGATSAGAADGLIVRTTP